MAITKAKARSVKHAVLSGDEQATVTIDGSTVSVALIELTGPSQKVSVQGSGTLAYTVDYSINGINFFGSQAVSATSPYTYSTHNVAVIRITWTSGTGRVTVLSV